MDKYLNYILFGRFALILNIIFACSNLNSLREFWIFGIILSLIFLGLVHIQYFKENKNEVKNPQTKE